VIRPSRGSTNCPFSVAAPVEAIPVRAGLFPQVVHAGPGEDAAEAPAHATRAAAAARHFPGNVNELAAQHRVHWARVTGTEGACPPAARCPQGEWRPQRTCVINRCSGNET